MDLRTITSTLSRPWLWFTKPLNKQELHPNPIIEFAKWYRLAKFCFWLEFPDACCLATVDKNGNPDNRIVLVREFDSRGFSFFTNYGSSKAEQIKTHPYGSLTFFWDALQRQVRISGGIEKTDRIDSERYFRSRGKESQIGAWASNQSRVLDSRESLENKIFEFSNQFKNIEVPLPEHWGGYRLKPEKIEFWKLRPARLHDRFLYKKDDHGEWKIEMLNP